MVIEDELLQKIYQFIVEFKQSQMVPNRIVINKQYLEIIRKKFPTFVDGDFFVSPEIGRIGIITTDEDYIGLSLAYDEFNTINYNRGSIN